MQHGLVVRMIRVRNKDQARSDPNTLLYQQGKAYDYFVLILEGRVEVKNETNSQTDQRGFPVEILRVLRLTVGRFFFVFFCGFRPGRGGTREFALREWALHALWQPGPGRPQLALHCHRQPRYAP